MTPEDRKKLRNLLLEIEKTPQYVSFDTPRFITTLISLLDQIDELELKLNSKVSAPHYIRCPKCGQGFDLSEQAKEAKE